MKIHIVGGGPAGLYFALLMKKQDPAHQIWILERDGPGDTYGWGIVFSDRTQANLEEADPSSHRQITASFETWENLDVVHRGERVSVGGNRFAGIARVRFLDILQRRCLDLGVEIAFRTPVQDVDSLLDCDLLVGADGANSIVRRRWQDAFRPTLDECRNRYIWLGTRRLFPGLTLTFREHAFGLFIAHSYKFSPEASTFIVETADETWERAGFARLSEGETCALLEDVFREDLHGHPLLTNNFVRWLSFVVVRNERWFHEHVVLLGDALHTAHFSIGSGTKAALEDALALARCFQGGADPAAALAEFERSRKPVVDELQRAARSSLLWFEEAASRMHLSPLELAFELMTRSERIDVDRLRRRDPDFVAAWERAAGGERR